MDFTDFGASNTLKRITAIRLYCARNIGWPTHWNESIKSNNIKS